MTLRINIHGGPGVGKSTYAAKLFADLKKYHNDIELITEYCKSWAWRKLPVTSWDQFYIFASQLIAEERVLRSGYACVITDCPLLMCSVYTNIGGYSYADDITNTLHKYNTQYPRVDVFIERAHAYKQEGRYQTEQEARMIDYDVFCAMMYQQPPPLLDLRYNPALDTASGVDYKHLLAQINSEIVRHKADETSQPQLLGRVDEQ